VLTTQRLPGRVTLTDLTDPNNCVEFATTNAHVAGELATGNPAAALSYNTVAGVFEAAPSSTSSNTTSIGAATPLALPKPSITPSTRQ
jgi:hypothetical protein